MIDLIGLDLFYSSKDILLKELIVQKNSSAGKIDSCDLYTTVYW